MAIYERPFWREKGLSGQATSDIGPARVVFDNSPPDGVPGVLLGFLEVVLPDDDRQAGPNMAALCGSRLDRCTGAGAETATVWNGYGYMDGAVQSGERASREVFAALGRTDEGP